MIKNLSSIQLLLVALAAVLLLVAAFSFYLLQDPSAPLPFAAAPATSTIPAPALTIITRPSETPIPTRQTSYTPFTSRLTPLSTGSPETSTATTSLTGTVTPSGTTPSHLPTKTATTAPSRTSSIAITPPTSSITPSPTITQTLSIGEHGVTGRVLQNGTPVANVIVEFKDDVAPRTGSTNSGGHYWFTTLAPGTTFSLTFKQSANPNLTPVSDITPLAWIQGTLPTGVNTIDLPDFEVSLNLNGMIFDLQSPTDGSTYSASYISSSNPIQFVWSQYSLAGSYHLELGPHGSDQPIWTSNQTASMYYMWDGTLNDGTHISQGAYWWRVAVTKSLGSYVVVIFAQPWDILFNP